MGYAGASAQEQPAPQLANPASQNCATRGGILKIERRPDGGQFGIAIPDNELEAQLAHLVRWGCTFAPDAYLFTVIDLAITAELSKLPKRS